MEFKKIVLELLGHLHSSLEMVSLDEHTTLTILLSLGLGEGNGDLECCKKKRVSQM